MNTIIHNQISTDLQELRKDNEAGLYNYIGAEIYALREMERVTAKMAEQSEEIKN